MGIRELLIEWAKNEGRTQGKLEGVLEGELRGELRGELKKQLEIARELKKEGLSIALIAKTTKLAVKQIEKL